MKKQTLLILVFITLLFSCKENKKSTHTINEKAPNNYQVKIDSLLNTYHKNDEFMGSIILSKNGKTVYENTVGFSDFKAKKKASSDTKYRIGSVTKTFTATLIFKAIEENKLKLMETIEHYFPNVKNANKITIAHLLQHRSGIHSFTKDKWFFDNRTMYISSKEMLLKISKYESDFEPNTKGEYSNSNYFLLALILEKIYNDSYENLLQEKICKPLNLNNTYSGKEINIYDNESYSYRFDEKWIEFPETDLSTAKGTGSIVSTPKDLTIFFESLLTGKVLSAENLTLMKTIKDRYGMGLFRYTTNDIKGFGHRGRIDEFRATSIYFSEEELSFTLMSNGSKIDINEIYTEILKLFLGDAPVKISESELKNFVGVYISQKDPNDKSVFIQENNTLTNFIKNEFKAPLIYKGKNRFVLEQMYAESISFTFSDDGKEMIFEQGGNRWNYIKE
ncbi:beta-lactamase family protein [Polaribacter litorisediminis]|uniref:serine hydrolase domain-containing protein n=1 Tax=Polaribacter litorisediminis TaxID=1908341 RepID=UPI001CBDBAC1|nr:serine hydrolase domain-containing protein [Polaribacter litorisediminis]UAM99059.1 beta-lactamase family protein [Polaribacter litorisediminis]